MSSSENSTTFPDVSIHPHILSVGDMKKNHSSLYDNVGRIRSTSLFWETRMSAREDRLVPLFTLKDKPHIVKKGNAIVTYPSLRQIYFTYDHAPGFEYEFSQDVFGSWDFWEKLTRTTLKDHFQAWRDELTIKIKARAIKTIIHAAKESSSTGISAARYLTEDGYIQKKIGRMTKEEKIRQQKIDAGIRDDLTADMERLGIKIMNGGKT